MGLPLSHTSSLKQNKSIWVIGGHTLNIYFILLLLSFSSSSISSHSGLTELLLYGPFIPIRLPFSTSPPIISCHLFLSLFLLPLPSFLFSTNYAYYYIILLLLNWHIYLKSFMVFYFHFTPANDIWFEVNRQGSQQLVCFS